MFHLPSLSVTAAAAAAVGFASFASAADLPESPPPEEPEVFNTWSGCYAGGNIGGGRSDIDQWRVSQFGVGPAPADYGSDSYNGFVIGGQFGCDYQFASNWVFGLRVMLNWSNMDGSHALVAFPAWTMEDRVKWYGTGTARLGYAFDSNLLLYGQGGFAWARNKSELYTPAGALSETGSWTATGWTVGAGMEWMFDSSWSTFIEFNHMDFGSGNENFNASPGFFPTGEVINVDQTIQTLMIGFNYRYNMGP